MPFVKCPECACEFEAPKDVVTGEILACPDCGLDLEVTEVGKDVVSVKVVTIEGEDWGE